MNTPKCPVCQKDISYLEAFFIKNQSAYTCSTCKRTLDIEVIDVFRKVGMGVLSFGFLTSIICVLFLKQANVWPLSINLVFFVLFFALSPFFIILKERAIIVDLEE